VLTVVGRILHKDQRVERNVLPHDLQIATGAVQLDGIVVHLEEILGNGFEGLEDSHTLLLLAVALHRSWLLAPALLLQGSF